MIKRKFILYLLFANSFEESLVFLLLKVDLVSVFLLKHIQCPRSQFPSSCECVIQSYNQLCAMLLSAIIRIEGCSCYYHYAIIILQLFVEVILAKV